MERTALNRYYTDVSMASGYPRFGLWAPARLPNGEHRFAFVKTPDGYANHGNLAEDVARLQELHPGENIFVAGWLDHGMVVFAGRPYSGMDWWPLGIITPNDHTIAFRYRNGLHNPNSAQALRYARARKNRLGSS